MSMNSSYGAVLLFTCGENITQNILEYNSQIYSKIRHVLRL